MRSAAHIHPAEQTARQTGGSSFPARNELGRCELEEENEFMIRMPSIMFAVHLGEIHTSSLLLLLTLLDIISMVIGNFGLRRVLQQWTHSKERKRRCKGGGGK